MNIQAKRILPQYIFVILLMSVFFDKLYLGTIPVSFSNQA